MNEERLHRLTATVPWNLFLLTVGGLVSTFGLKCIAAPQGFVSGGLYGLAMLADHLGSPLNIAVWYALLNIPILFMGWFMLSRRFMLYTIYCIAVTTVATELMTWQVPIADKTLAAVAAGILSGAGSGIAVRSLGSDGGLNIISLILHQRYGFSVGSFGIAFNAVLFAVALPIISIDNVLYSLVITYMTATLMNYFMGLFNQRKLVFVVSSKHGAIAQSILTHLGRGCTLLHGQGAFTRQDREVLLTVVHNIQLRRLEEIVFQEDPQAFVIIEDTHMVLGKGFSQRRHY